MKIVTHFLATTLGVQAMGLEGRDKALAYAFGMGVDIDHAVKLPFYPYSPWVTRGWLTSIPDHVKERILFVLLLAANVGVYWLQHRV